MARIETVDTAERDEVLARVLAPSGGIASTAMTQVRSFACYIEACGLEWVAWRCRRQRRETACLLALLLPGRTAIAMFPSPGARNIEPGDQRQLMAVGLERLADRKLHYVQALVEPQAADKRELLEASGFTHLTQLIYLQRAAASPSFEDVRAHEATWIS